MAAALVVDTSVLVKWFKTEDEDLTAEARALLERVERARAEVYAPALLLYEVGNLLTRKSDLDDDGVAAVLAGIAASSLIVAPPDRALLARAARLVTADRTLARRTRASGLVHHLADAAVLP
jgi:predicted nucleic acid-binding protein